MKVCASFPVVGKPLNVAAGTRNAPCRGDMTPTRVRYQILGLTAFTAFVMYVHRVSIGTAAPAIREEFGFDKVTMGWIFAAFSWGYALFQTPGGWAGDKYGPRRILALSIAWWSIFTIATGTAVSGVWMAVYRFLFGVGQAAGFPVASRSLVRWLPLGQRALGQGVQHAGSRFGAAVTPPLVVVLMAYFGWRLDLLRFWNRGSVVDAALVPVLQRQPRRS